MDPKILVWNIASSDFLIPKETEANFLEATTNFKIYLQT